VLSFTNDHVRFLIVHRMRSFRINIVGGFVVSVVTLLLTHESRVVVVVVCSTSRGIHFHHHCLVMRGRWKVNLGRVF